MPCTLTVGQLIHQLQTLSPDLPVYLAINPDWPFAHTVNRLVEGTSPAGPAVYIAENGQHDYLPTAVQDQLTWNAS